MKYKKTLKYNTELINQKIMVRIKKSLKPLWF